MGDWGWGGSPANLRNFLENFRAIKQSSSQHTKIFQDRAWVI